MSKSKRPNSPGSVTTTTTTVKSGPGGRRYTTRIEKSKPKYTFRVETKSKTEPVIPEELDLDGKHFTTRPGILKVLQLFVAIICMVFFSPPLTWFTRLLCAVVAICFAVTIFICFFYLLTLYRVVFPTWPWLKLETLYTNSAALAYLVSSVLQLIFTNKEEYKISLEFHDYYHDYIVAGLTGLVNFVLYALGGQLLHNKLRSINNRQPRVHIIQTTLDRKGKPIKRRVMHERQSTLYRSG